MKRLNESWIILVFAALHALIAFVTRLVGIDDELILTLFTMMMSVILSMKRNMSTPLMIAFVVCINFLAYYFASGCRILIQRIPFPEIFLDYLDGALCTFLTTVAMGWLQVLCSCLVQKYGKTDKFAALLPKAGSLEWVILAFATILVVRLFMAFRKASFVENVMLNVTIDYVFSLLMILWMTSYVLNTERNILIEKKKRNQAQYSYAMLKQLIAPHFLFNSLNTLNSIVISGDRESASDFIFKLSGIYRYLLDNENEPLVYLEDEICFVEKYVELMQVRFPSGFEVRMDVGEEAQSKMIIPCALQLLVENALKHNTISAKKPLQVRVSAEDGFLTVTNNVSPKRSSQESTGGGQRYIRQRYHDETGKEVIILPEKENYTVKLPLI